MPVAVRNREAGPTVFSIPEAQPPLQIEWQGHGDPNGLDVRYVQPDLLENVQFSEMLRRGIFEIVEEADATVAMDRQSEAHREKKDADAAAAASSMVLTPNNDLVQVPCIGPSSKGQGECGEPVPVRELEKDDKPILCSRHASLAPQFAQVETDQLVEKGDSLVPVKKWVRTQVSAREKQIP